METLRRKKLKKTRDRGKIVYIHVRSRKDRKDRKVGQFAICRREII